MARRKRELALAPTLQIAHSRGPEGAVEDGGADPAPPARLVQIAPLHVRIEQAVAAAERSGRMAEATALHTVLVALQDTRHKARQGGAESNAGLGLLLEVEAL